MSTIIRNPFKKTAAPLVEQLASKGQDLRIRQADELDNAESLKQAAQTALTSAATADRQAAAVERATAILDEAGVSL